MPHRPHAIKAGIEIHLSQSRPFVALQTWAPYILLSLASLSDARARRSGVPSLLSPQPAAILPLPRPGERIEAVPLDHIRTTREETMARVVMSFTLDSQKDARILHYLEGLPRGERSAAIRLALDAHLGGGSVTMGDIYQGVITTSNASWGADPC